MWPIELLEMMGEIASSSPGPILFAFLALIPLIQSLRVLCSGPLSPVQASGSQFLK